MTTSYCMIRYGMIRYGMIQYGMTRYGMMNDLKWDEISTESKSKFEFESF